MARTMPKVDSLLSESRSPVIPSERQALISGLEVPGDGEVEELE